MTRRGPVSAGVGPTLACVVVLVLLGGSVGGAQVRSSPGDKHLRAPILEGLSSIRPAPTAVRGPAPPVVPRDLPPGVADPQDSLHNALAVSPCDAVRAWNVEVQQAFDPATGALYEAWIGCGGIGFSRSLDGGYSFGPAIAVPGSTTGPHGPTNSSWDPSVEVAPNGTVYVAYMVNRTNGDAPVVAWSYDHGATFAGYQYAFRPALTEFSDRDFLAVAPNGTLYLSWDYSPDTALDQVRCAAAGSCYFLAGDFNILVVHSADGGANWSNPVPTDPEYPNGGSPAGPVVVEPNGNVDVLYEDYQVGVGHALAPGHNYFTQSTDGGRSWSPPIEVENGSIAPGDWWIDGDLARDNSGTLYASFDTQNGSVDRAGVAVSRDDGATWSTTIPLNPDVNGAAHIEVAVAGGENGTAYLGWMGNNSSSGWSTFEEVLSGNGSSLGPPLEVSDAFGLDGYWVGDTIGVTYLGVAGHVAVSWSYALPSPTPAVEVYEAVVGVAPLGPPRGLHATPGPGNATVGWEAPLGAPFVGGYVVTWGVEGQHAFFDNVSGSITQVVLTALQPFARYVISVAAVNLGGVGTFSSPLNLTLTAYSVIEGSVTPPTASVTVDGLAATVVGGEYSFNTTPGGHVLAARSSTVVPEILSVDLPWNGTTWVNLSLVLLPGTAAGHVSPRSASVSWDGNVVTLGGGGSYLEVGAAGSIHTLRASAPGYIPQQANLTLVSNATVWLNLTLEPVNVTLQLYVSPATASVTLNGTTVVLSANGRANLSRAPGVYEVSAGAPGYLPYHENITLTSGVQPLVVDMTPRGNTPGGPSGTGGGIPTWAWVALVAVLAGVVLVALVGILRPKRPEAEEPATDVYSGPSDAPGAPSNDGAESAGAPRPVDATPEELPPSG